MTDYLIIAPIKGTDGLRAGLLAVPRTDAGGMSLSEAILLTGTDQEVGAKVREMLAEQPTA